ncbi:MAG TPA: MBL fold metallo-hydrolase [Anaeromyxobacteraceae bacterium]|nr:MBL fold metallo-hydrolase [Anaeromyxobacteraceae bacterium]
MTVFDRRRYGTTNYLYLLAEGPDAVLVDPADPDEALALAAAHGLAPRWILHTHGHADHSGGSAALRQRLGARVLGHGADAAWFAPDEDLAGRAEVALGRLRLRLHAVPGHTPGSILVEWQGRLLTGDTLFWGGCGNCRHGGDVRALAASFLGPLAGLDGALLVHPGHDYAEANLPFVLALEPSNQAAAARLAAVRAARSAGEEPAAPTLAEERAVNPFLRATDAGAFAALRARRDAW